MRIKLSFESFKKGKETDSVSHKLLALISREVIEQMDLFVILRTLHQLHICTNHNHKSNHKSDVTSFFSGIAKDDLGHRAPQLFPEDQGLAQGQISTRPMAP